MSKLTITIDPGKGGGFAVRYPQGGIVAYKFTSEADCANELASLCSEYLETEALLERVHAMPGQGVTSMFTFGANYGFWRGALQALGIPFREMTPQQWQKGLMLGKLKGPERKRALCQLAKERYPAAKPTLATADCLLMMEVMPL